MQMIVTLLFVHTTYFHDIIISTESWKKELIWLFAKNWFNEDLYYFMKMPVKILQ